MPECFFEKYSFPLKREDLPGLSLQLWSTTQVLGPRYTFLKAIGMDQVLHPDRSEHRSEENDVTESTPNSSLTASSQYPIHHDDHSSSWMLMIVAVLGQEDEDWCGGLGLPYSQFREHAVHFQTDYTEQITQVWHRLSVLRCSL
jgi:hypothetical protein